MMTNEKMALNYYRNVIDQMQGHTFFVVDDDGFMRRWMPPNRPALDPKNGEPEP